MDPAPDNVVEFLEWISWQRVNSEGGYPDDVQVLGDHIVVATIDQDAPRLKIYETEKAEARFRLAKKLLAEDDGIEDLAEAWWETEVEGSTHEVS